MNLISRIVVMLCFGLLDVGLSSDARAAENWQGQWIGPAKAGTNSWIAYRKTLRLEKAPGPVVARIAVDSKYWLWINGKQVVFEGGLKRGPTPRNTYYDEVELGTSLKKGDNTIAVLVWYFGKNGFSHNSSGKAGLVLDSVVPGLASDASWKVLIHPGYGESDEPRPNYRLPESNVAFDARKDIPGWMLGGFDDSAWSGATAFGAPPVAPWNELEKRPTPQFKNSGLVDYVSVETSKDNDGNQIVTGKLPYNAQITPYLKVEGPAGKKIDMRTDDYQGGGACSVRGTYTTRDGTQEYESLAWMNGHLVQYRVPAGVKVLEVKYRETGYNAEFVGRFRCDDEALNTLWKKAQRTLYITMRDNYMDCPDRERAQWWGDMVNELGESFYVFDFTNGPAITRKGIHELARWQRADGTLYSPVPAGRPANDSMRGDQGNGTWNMELPPQMLASVGKYGFWTYYFYTGDKQTIQDVYPHVRDYLKVWQLENGLVVHRKGDWDWEDWGENIDAAVLDSAWYHLALEAAVNMAKVCGQEQDVAEWQARMSAIEGAFNANFWNGNEYRSAAYKGDTDDRANAMAVVAGLAGADKYAALRDVFAKHRNASPYMEKYVIEALYLMKAPEQAVTRMRERFKSQIESWTSTLWEGWGLGAEGFGGGTYNHAWSGGALTALCQYGTGVAPELPAYERYHVLPQMGPLKSIQTTVPTPKGAVQVDLKDAELEFQLKLDSPAGTVAIVGIPVKAGHQSKSMEINGQVVWTRDGQNNPVDGVSFEGVDDQFVRFTVQPGKWTFVSKYE